MEKIKVNMNPNPLDVQTIHASQNDGEARQWEFELHNNGELIDTSEVKEQLVFKAYKGGTEQLLPENTSTPTTSPFKGDIKYPQGLLSDQEFLYRESPTEEDGLARIDKIKGNTLIWNQLVKNGNFADTYNWTTGNATLSVSSNKATLTVTKNGTVPFYQTINQKTAEHKVLVLFNAYASRSLNLTVNWGFQLGSAITLTTSNQRFAVISTLRTFGNNNFNLSAIAQTDDVINYSNVQLFDLTQMFGAGNEPITVEEFTSLFPLSYYDFNQGTLLSFNGNGIKTVGKNLFDGNYNNFAFGNTVVQDSTFRGYTLNVSALKGKQITVSRADTTSNNRFRASFFSVEPNVNTPFERYLNSGDQYHTYDSQLSFSLTVPNGANYLLLYISNNETEAKDLMIEIGSTVSDYEPYTSSTLSLPISTYFPTGMKSAGNVYDELTPRKAITRIGAVDLGSLTWNYVTSLNRFDANISDIKQTTSESTIPNLVCSAYPTRSWNNHTDKCVTMVKDVSRVCIVDSAYTSASAFKTAMSGVYLYYETTTPTETSFTTASLVTENAEIPLSNEDGTLIGKCTEQLSAEPGFHDAKIKLTDSDGECYSNKLQLHVERSPQ